MNMRNNVPPPRKILIAKILLMSLIGGVTLYCLYAVIGQFIIWLMQPRFINVVDGTRAASMGFVLQTLVFIALFLILATATVIMGIRFFRKPKASKAAPPDDAAQSIDSIDNSADGTL